MSKNQTKNKKRCEAQSEAHSIAMNHVPLAGQDKYTREEARNSDKSWTNISTLYVHNSASVKGLNKAMNSLKEAGYRCELNHDDNYIEIEVKVTGDMLKGVYK